MRLLTKRIMCHVPLYYNTSVDWYSRIEARMCELFESCSCIIGTGCWKDNSEQMAFIYSYTTAEGMRHGAPRMRELMKEMGRDLKEEKVALEINGKLELWEVIEDEEVESDSE